MEEPSVLDYVKSKLTPWKGVPIALPAGPARPADQLTAAPEGLAAPDGAPGVPMAALARPAAEAARAGAAAWPWRSLAGLALAIAGQRLLAPPDRAGALGAAFLAVGAGLAAWAYWRGEWQPAALPRTEIRPDDLAVRGTWQGAGVVLALLAFATSTDNLFTITNLLALGLSLACLLRAFWRRAPQATPWGARLGALLSQSEWRPRITRWTLVLLLAVAAVLFFRTYRLDSVPPEMVSDHAEKYLDVADVLNGGTHIFFPRNGGREALQFYLIAALHLLFNAPLNHMTLKISTTLIGLASLPFVYLVGKEAGNRRVALLAFLFAGMAYWTIVVSRAGMRLPFYFLFTAATLYYLLRGIRTSSRNDFILAGISLGLSFYGYSADRLLPVVVVMAVSLYLLHRQSAGQRKQVMWWTVALALFSFVIFLPLLRYISQDPQGFGYRMFSRVGSLEQPLPEGVFSVFLGNLWNALKMFSWSDGVIWVVSIPQYPALDIIAGGLFYTGAALLLARYIRRRHWLDLFLLVSIPLLMMPSILSLAFPDENPNLYRTGGAMVPVFLMAALALDGLMQAFETRFEPRWGKRFAWGAALALLAAFAFLNYDLVFNQYYQQYQLSAVNTSEMGQVIRDFSEATGDANSAWVMGYPYWADTRLVAINAGYPNKDYALFVNQLPATLENPRAKLFILNPQDQEGVAALKGLYPRGWLQTYVSKVETKDFLMYFVPPEG